MGAAATALSASNSHSGFASPKRTLTAVNFEVPKGACDCHTHIFGDPERFPFAETRAYTPELAGLDQLQTLHQALHITRVVIVQPSVYGTDNSCTLEAIRKRGANARGIAVVDDNISPKSLDEMHRFGIRGVRINLETLGQTDPAAAKRRFRDAVKIIRSRDHWHIQIYTRPSVIAAIENEVSASPVAVTFDHLGGVQAAAGLQQPGFDALWRLVKGAKAYVKISAPYRSSTNAPDYADVAPFAKALLEANPHQILWASDWPHPQQIAGRAPDEVTPPYAIDDGRLFNDFALWVANPAQRKMILVDNPGRLYAF